MGPFFDSVHGSRLAGTGSVYQVKNVSFNGFSRLIQSNSKQTTSSDSAIRDVTVVASIPRENEGWLCRCRWRSGRVTSSLSFINPA